LHNDEASGLCDKPIFAVSSGRNKATQNFTASAEWMTCGVSLIVTEEMSDIERSAHKEFLENIDDDEAVAIVRRCLIPSDRLQIRAQIGKGIPYIHSLSCFSNGTVDCISYANGSKFIFI